jgi:hypothetical protein
MDYCFVDRLTYNDCANDCSGGATVLRWSIRSSKIDEFLPRTTASRHPRYHCTSMKTPSELFIRPSDSIDVHGRVVKSITRSQSKFLCDATRACHLHLQQFRTWRIRRSDQVASGLASSLRPSSLTTRPSLDDTTKMRSRTERQAQGVTMLLHADGRFRCSFRVLITAAAINTEICDCRSHRYDLERAYTWAHTHTSCFELTT